ncbi:factor of dna methylation 2 [Quercus suber]|uniref:Factor of dna methylation 2 n=1 Tax=Quercus suber TaxID=58331 RepID=A0AAW0L9J1_QUESU
MKNAASPRTHPYRTISRAPSFACPSLYSLRSHSRASNRGLCFLLDPHESPLDQIGGGEKKKKKKKSGGGETIGACGLGRDRNFKIYVQMSDNKNEEELNQVRRLAVSLSNEIDYKNQRLLEMEHKHNETTATVHQLVVGLTKEIDSKQKSLLEMEQKYSESATYVKLLVNEIDKLHAEKKKMHSINRKLEGAMECKKKELMQHAKELEESKTHNDLERRNLMNVIEKLEGKLQAQNTVECDNNLHAQINTLRKELDEKTDAMQDLESLNCVLTVKERMTNQELQEARKEAVESLQDMLNGRSNLGIKRMGEIDWKPFQHMCSQKFPGMDWKKISAELCSKWQERLRNPQWQPFKIINTLRKELDEKTDAMQDLESLNCVLTVKERMTNQELKRLAKKQWRYGSIHSSFAYS